MADLLQTPQAVFGTSKRSLFCAVRDITLVRIADNEVPLRWAILSSYHRQASTRACNSKDDVVVLQLKQKAYRSVRQQMTRKGSPSTSDNIIYTALGAGIVEHRLGERELARKHLEAAFTLWIRQQKPGSKERILLPDGLTFCVGFIGIGVQNQFKSITAFYNARTETLNVLEQMELWNRNIRLSNPAFDSNHAIAWESGNEDHTSRTVSLMVRSDTFRRDGLIGHLLVKLMMECTEYGIRLALGTLFAINEVLYVLREDEAATIGFLDRLAAHVYSTSQDDTASNITSTAFIYIVGICASRSKHTSELYLSCFTPRSWMQFVDLMMLSSSDSQHEIKDFLLGLIYIDQSLPAGQMSGKNGWTQKFCTESDAAWQQRAFNGGMSQ